MLITSVCLADPKTVTEPIPTAQLRNQEPSRKLTYKTVDSRELQLHVFEPEGHRVTDQRACFLIIHGGGWSQGQPRGFYPYAIYFAKQGMVGVSLEYRLLRKGAETVADCAKDARSAIRWLRMHATELGIDPNKIVVSGASAGGHLAAGTALFDGVDEADEDVRISSVPNAVVLYYAVLSTSNTYGRKWCGEKWEHLSPLHRVKSGLPPTIIFHGSADMAAPFADARAFCEAMRKAGNRCELVAHEGGKHGYFLASQALFDEVLQKTAVFLRSLGFLETTAAPSDIPSKAVPNNTAEEQETVFAERKREDEQRRQAGLQRVLGTATLEASYLAGRAAPDAVAFRYRFQVVANESVYPKFWKILFLFLRLAGPDGGPHSVLRCLHQNNRPAYEHSDLTRKDAQQRMRTQSREVGFNFSVADAQRTKMLGSRTHDPVMFPKRLAEVDGIADYWSHAHFAQRNLNGQTVAVEVRRGRQTTERAGWSALGDLPRAVYRVWTMSAEFDGKRYSVDFVLPDQHATYLDKKRPIVLATEAFYLHPGLFKLVLWDFAIQRENEKAWIPIHHWKLTKVVGGDSAKNTWGFKATSAQGVPAIEASNDDTPTYLKQGDSIDLSAGVAGNR
jgi:acetyl esterase/lipase